MSLYTEWLRVLPIEHRRRFPADAMIVDENASRRIQVVLQGVVRLSLVAPDGRERVFLHLPMGGIFGEQTALSDANDSSEAMIAWAETACEIGFVEPTEFLSLLQENRGLLRALLHLTHEKKRMLVQELERAVFRSARSQIAELVARLNQSTKEPGVVKVSQDRLAHLSGRTRVTVAAQLHYLESVGAIRMERTRIVVIDPELLASVKG